MCTRICYTRVIFHEFYTRYVYVPRAYDRTFDTRLPPSRRRLIRLIRLIPIILGCRRGGPDVAHRRAHYLYVISPTVRPPSISARRFRLPIVGRRSGQAGGWGVETPSKRVHDNPTLPYAFNIRIERFGAPCTSFSLKSPTRFRLQPTNV